MLSQFGGSTILVLACLMALTGCQAVLRDSAELSFVDGKFSFKANASRWEYPDQDTNAEAK